MKNKSLNSDLKNILNDKNNINSITKGSVSSSSIEIGYKEPLSVASYTYYDNTTDRDIDFIELTELIPDLNG